jgi:hypothetical protein
VGGVLGALNVVVGGEGGLRVRAIRNVRPVRSPYNTLSDQELRRGSA